MSGAPFLIARGRRRGYSTLLAPGWLLAANDHGFLEDAVGPIDAPVNWRSGVAVSPGGRRVGLVWAEHAVTSVEAGGPGAGWPGAGGLGAGGPGAGDGVLRDEHSRPLRLLYGFACADAAVVAVAAADLDHSRVAAIGTYRRFLAEEERFTAEASTPFDLTSAVAGLPGGPPPRPAAPARPVAPVRAFAPASAAAPRPMAVAGSQVAGKVGKSRRVAPFVAVGAAVAALLVAGGILLSATSGDPPQPTCDPTPTSTVRTSAPISAPLDGEPTLPPCR